MAGSCSPRLGFLFAFFGVVLGAIAIFTSYWVQSTAGSYRKVKWGLWVYCDEEHCRDLGIHNHVPVWLRSVQVLFCIGECSYMVALVLGFMYTFMVVFHRSHTIMKLLIFTLVCTFAEMLTAIVVFGVKRNNQSFPPKSPGPLDFSWSFYIAMVSTATVSMAAVMFICEVSETRRRASYRYVQPVGL